MHSYPYRPVHLSMFFFHCIILYPGVQVIFRNKMFPYFEKNVRMKICFGSSFEKARLFFMENTTTNKEFHDLHFDSIQALRGLAALFVVFQHVRFLNFGAFGVDIFFCISGFMIMFTTEKNTKYFFRKRLIRILPLYYIMTIGTYLLLVLFPSMFQQTRPHLSYLIKSLLFLPFDIGGGVIQPLVRIGWTVNCEMLFYLLFFIAFHISMRYRGLICGAFLAVLVGVVQIFAPAISSWHSPLGSILAPVLTFYGDPVMLEFLFGIAAYYLLRYLYRRHSIHPVSKSVSIASAVSIPVIFCLLAYFTPRINVIGFRRLPLWGLPALLLLLLAFLAGLRLTMPRFWVLLGNISYSLYLVHYYPVMFLDRAVFDFSTLSVMSVVGLVVSVILSVMLAYLSWILIERKFTGWLRKWLLR